jgi:hypothetical protein
LWSAASFADSGSFELEWKAINTAPSGQRVLVCDDKGRVKIAQLMVLRWVDDSDTTIGRPVWWMPLPEPPKSEPMAKERPSGARYSR